MRNVMNLSKEDKLVYSFDPDGMVVISKFTSCEDGQVLNNFLNFLAKDIENSPQNLVPITVEKLMKISSLVEDIKIDLETPLDADEDE
jgi:antitoxin PrlF